MLIGRDEEVAAVVAALAGDRLVTLIGTGGVGKTTLAVAAAQQVDESAPQVLLAPLNRADLAEHAAGSAGFRSFTDMVASLAASPRLVILDNCEHVLDAAAALAEELLAIDAEVRILATSREPLDVAEERIVRLEPLPTDGPDSPAAQLYRHLAERTGAVVTDTDDDIQSLCRSLDGLPLALELAAARSSAMTAAEMTSRLGTRLSVLTTNRRGTPERHRSLNAAIAWSYQLLESDLQRLTNRLSLFPGRFTAEMAGFVAPAGMDVEAGVSALVDRSLAVHEPHLGTSWFRMLETIKAFAGDRLGASGEADDVADRLVDALVGHARRLDEAGAQAMEIVPRQLGRSFDTIRWAIERCVERDTDPDRAHALIAPLWWLEDVGYQAIAAAAVESVLERWPEPSAGRAIGLGILGSVQRIAGREEQAAASARTAIESAPGVGHAYAYRTLGQIERGRGNWKDALVEFEKGARAATAAGYPALTIEIEMHGAMTEARAGRIESAVEWLEALMSRAEDYPHARAWAAMFLCWVLHGTDDERAEEIARFELGEAIRIGNSWGEAAAHSDLAVACLGRDEHAEAAEHLLRSFELYDEMNNRTDITVALSLSACLLVRLGEIDEARQVEALSRSYTMGAWGEFEDQLFDDLGPLPAVDGARAMTADRLRLRLGAVAKGQVSASEQHPVESLRAGNRFTLDGDHWVVAFGGDVVRVRTSKGMGDIHSLLDSVGRDVAAMDLMGAAVESASAGPVADRQARTEIEARIRDLQEAVDHAEAANDPFRAEQATIELDQLVDSLSGMFGIGGRERHMGETAERARSAVTARIRSSIKKLEELHPALGRHLRASISTGRFCRYDPAEPTSWEL